MLLSPTRATIISALLCTLAFGPALAEDKNKDETADTSTTANSEEEIRPTTEAVTIYVDVRWGARTKKAAANLNEQHAKYESWGYILQDIDLYNENGDLKGFFVTYRKY